MHLSEFIVRKRFIFLIAAVVIAIACALLIPHTNINTDMTRYLPNDSQMKQGIDRMSEEFGADAVGTGMVRVMFWSLPDSLKNPVKDELSNIDGVSNILYQNGSEEYNQGEKVLYELLCGSQRSQEDIANEIAEKYGDRIIVEKSENGTSAPIGVILIAFVLLLIVLFIMCESWLEPPIFLAAIGVAVAINMGTNALFKSVSVTTNSIAAILQLVLSIDYSIILMNRYRQEKSLANGDKITAMTHALKKASSSIVSSAFTTIVGLLALVFMKLKIGADMGVVLAKGVLCSLVSIYTVLPTIILALDSAIEKSTKKVLKLNTDRLAGFSMKFRIPLAIVFVILFAGSYYLHNKTEISFSFEQKSEIEKYFPPKNIIVLLYDNSDATRVIELADTVTTLPNVKSFISYPSLMQKKMTATETKNMVGGLTAMAGDSDLNLADFDLNTIVDAIYYMGSRNTSEEKMSLHDFASLAAELSADTTLSAYLGDVSHVSEDELQYLNILVSLTDTCLIDRELTAEELSDIVGIDNELISIICPPGQKASIREILKLSKELLNESMLPSRTNEKTPESQLVEQQVDLPIGNDSIEITENTVTNENISILDDENAIYKDSTIFLKQYSASEIAQMVGMNERHASIIFNLYGRTVKQKTKTMSLYDFIRFVINDIANRKIFASQIDQESRRLLRQKESLMLATLQAGKTEATEEEPIAELEENPTETILVEIADEQEEAETVMDMPEVDKENIDKLYKAEKIMAIAKKGSRFDSAEMHGLLTSLGAKMEMRDIELAYLYNGIRHFDDENVKMSAEDILKTLNDSVINRPHFASLINDEMRSGMDTVNVMIDENFSQLRGHQYSQAIVFSDLPKESDATHDFVETLAAKCDNQLESIHYLIGESVMMNEMRNQFGDEMLLVTLITILSIFLIVALTFRSLAVPAILVMTVLTAVYIDVTVSGLNGGRLLYLAYLIMQSILMGATIDYGILFTNNYREARTLTNKTDSIRKAYQASMHTILTSGTIMTLAPFAMSIMIDDATIATILRCIATGALAAVLLIIFVLPGLLAAFDRFVVGKQGQEKTCGETIQPDKPINK
jgi:predicted RND superfamily exporter protein/HSP20 family molecular chaperone IbpA